MGSFAGNGLVCIDAANLAAHAIDGRMGEANAANIEPFAEGFDREAEAGIDLIYLGREHALRGRVVVFEAPGSVFMIAMQVYAGDIIRAWRMFVEGKYRIG